MRIVPKPLIAVVGVGALASVGLLGSVAPSQSTAAPHNRFVNEIETVLAMTPAQKDQARTGIEHARESATPIRQEVMTTNRELRAAIRSNDTARIERLSTTEGQEIGRLLAIRSTAVAKVYNTLTPAQRTKADALQKLLTQGIRQRMEQSNSRVGS